MKASLFLPVLSFLVLATGQETGPARRRKPARRRPDFSPRIHNVIVKNTGETP